MSRRRSVFDARFSRAFAHLGSLCGRTMDILNEACQPSVVTLQTRNSRLALIFLRCVKRKMSKRFGNGSSDRGHKLTLHSVHDNSLVFLTTCGSSDVLLPSCRVVRLLLVVCVVMFEPLSSTAAAVDDDPFRGGGGLDCRIDDEWYSSGLCTAPAEGCWASSDVRTGDEFKAYRAADESDASGCDDDGCCCCCISPRRVTVSSFSLPLSLSSDG